MHINILNQDKNVQCPVTMAATYIKQLFYVHLFIDFFPKNILVLPNKHNVGVCQVHSWFLLRGKNMEDKKVLVLISKAII